MIAFLIPDHFSESQVEAVLDQHWERGYTYLKGSQEDYTRIWFGDQERVRYRSVGLYSTAMLQLEEQTSHLADLKVDLGLMDLKQVLEVAQLAVGRQRIRAIMQLGCMVAANEMNPELDDLLGSFWTCLLSSDEALMISLALNIAYPVSASHAVRRAVRNLKDSAWAQNVADLETHWARSTEPSATPEFDDSHMNCDCEH